jgi:TRAP-type C4-dicarboxylate transport system substrate-binding protein
VLLSAAILVGLPGTVPSTRAEESITLRIASWKKTLEGETDGRLKLRFYPGGSQGDERDFVRKMRVGQLDGGVVTMTGMSMLVRPMVILVLPDFLDTYEKLDRVRQKMAKDFEKMFNDEGFMMVAWGDAGKTRLFSQNKIEQPSDIKSMRPWMWKDDLVFIEFYDVIGANGVRLGVPEVYPGLQTKMVDVVTSSALTAVALQWYTRVKYMTGHNTAIIAGGMVMRKEKIEGLPPDLKEAFLRTCERVETLLNRTIRRDDQKAYDVVINKGIVATDTSKYKAEWDAAAKQVRDRMTGRVFSKSLFQAVEAAAVE